MSISYDTWSEVFYNISSYSWTGLILTLFYSLQLQLLNQDGTKNIIKGNIYYRSKFTWSRCKSSKKIKESCEVFIEENSIIMCEAAAILWSHHDNYLMFAYCRYALFWAGIAVKFSNLACGYILI